MTRSIHRWLWATLLLTLGNATHAALDGAALFQARCASCHGPQGQGQASFQAPPLAGQDEAYLLRQLQHLRSGQRGGGPAAATMQAVAQSLPDEAAVAALARYASRLKPTAQKNVPPVPGSPQMAGKALYSVCMACHGGSGEGNTALSAPRLNTLPSWYTVAQLKAFRSGLRGSGPEDAPGQQMRRMAVEALADDEAVDAVSAFITTMGSGR